MFRRLVSRNMVSVTSMKPTTNVVMKATNSMWWMPNGPSHGRLPPQRPFAMDHHTAGEDEEMDFFDASMENNIHYPSATASIGQPAPTFTTKAVVEGEIVDLALQHDDPVQGQWTALLFYPKDFTFVCPTELIAFSDRQEEFEALNTKIMAISTDTAECHLAWTRLPRSQGGLGRMKIPLLADVTKQIAAQYGVLNETEGIAFRGLFLINPEGILEQSTVNNFPVGRSVDETLRLLQAFQYVAQHGEVCPANWTPGSPTIIANPEDSQEYFSTLAEDTVETGLDTIRTAKEVEDLIASGEPVVLDFMASWCGKCTQIEPFVAELALEYGSVRFVKVDTSGSDMEAVKEKYGVSALPTFQCFKNGQPVGTAVSGYKKRLLKEQVVALAGQ